MDEIIIRKGEIRVERHSCFVLSQQTDDLFCELLFYQRFATRDNDAENLIVAFRLREIKMLFSLESFEKRCMLKESFETDQSVLKMINEYVISRG